ncbi:PREDICTED: uncharacterized protein LOC102029416 [Chinchilla lanigera]|uniref:uncharacterized protein LOC102029416 n=1 Tax=Chinchilla lanigera TaxID=34839 RepID=UPI00038E957B|nr:PREDICTED: uncharacterized protein LOC102029416 [Chinchilla lanigera]
MPHYNAICKLDFTNLGILSSSSIRTVGYGHLIRLSCAFLSNCFGCICPVSGAKLQLPLEHRLCSSEGYWERGRSIQGWEQGCKQRKRHTYTQGFTVWKVLVFNVYPLPCVTALRVGVLQHQPSDSETETKANKLSRKELSSRCRVSLEFLTAGHTGPPGLLTRKPRAEKAESERLSHVTYPDGNLGKENKPQTGPCPITSSLGHGARSHCVERFNYQHYTCLDILWAPREKSVSAMFTTPAPGPVPHI